jgi:hypothetical protein
VLSDKVVESTSSDPPPAAGPHQKQMLLLFDGQQTTPSLDAVLATRYGDGQNDKRQYDAGDAGDSQCIVTI